MTIEQEKNTDDFMMMVNFTSSDVDLSDDTMRVSVLNEFFDIFSRSPDEYLKRLVSEESLTKSNRSWTSFSINIPKSEFAEAKRACKSMFDGRQQYLMKSGKINVEHMFCGTRQDLMDAAFSDEEKFLLILDIKSDRHLSTSDLQIVAEELASFGRHMPSWMTVDNRVSILVSKVFNNFSCIEGDGDLQYGQIAFTALIDRAHFADVKEYIEYRFREGMLHVSAFGPTWLTNIAAGDQKDIKCHIIESREYRLNQIQRDIRQARRP